MRASLALPWLLCSLLTASAHAQEADGLRARLERLTRTPPAGVPRGSLTSVAYLLDVAERVERRFPGPAAAWRARAARYLGQLEQGTDPYPAARGEIVNRGYRSAISTRRQGYAIYIPPDYDPSRRYPTMLVLHGGSSNGNLFLGVVLGNNMNWKTYDQHLWDDYRPRITPDWIVVAPDGFGQVMWRWMGEQDVLDVLQDVTHHYAVDPDRVVLSGLSNGGVGAYSLGARHAWRFSAVQAIAGAPGWRQYAGERRVREPEATLMRTLSGYDLALNYAATDFRYYHGDSDPGPMRPAFVRAFSERLRSLGVPARGTWYEAGHDLLYLVQRRERSFERLAKVRRQPRPRAVTVVSGDYRAARQHWLALTRIRDYPRLAQARARLEGDTLRVETERVDGLRIDLRALPETPGRLRITIDTQQVFAGSRADLGHRLHLTRDPAQGWRLGPPSDTGLVKRPGLSGPLTDAYFGRCAHVYGTQNPDHTRALKQIAETGARGWPKWLWGVTQPVLADRDVTPEVAASHHLVLYGTPGDNAVLEQLAAELPIRVDAQGVSVGTRRFDGAGVGTRFIYPNPRAAGRYVIVQAAPTVEGVRRGHKLPDFVPDYIVYDARSTRVRPRLVPPASTPARGFFDDQWKLREP